MKHPDVLHVALVGTLFLLPQFKAGAQMVPIAPFYGSLQDSFEEYPDFDGTDFFQEGSAIFQNHATVTSLNQDMIIYHANDNDNDPTFGLGTSGAAIAPDNGGYQGLALFGFPDTATITFDKGLTAFGGYVGATTYDSLPLTDPAVMTMNYFAGSTLVGTQTFDYSHSSTGDGKLDWHGYYSSTPFDVVTISGNGIALDDLHATYVPEPEATSLLLTAIVCGGFAFVVSKMRRRSA